MSSNFNIYLENNLQLIVIQVNKFMKKNCHGNLPGKAGLKDE